MSEDKSKKSIGLKGHTPNIGYWVCSFGESNTYGFGNTFEKAEYNFINNIRDEEREKYMLEKMKL